jgi:hypothetical protein
MDVFMAENLLVNFGLLNVAKFFHILPFSFSTASPTVPKISLIGSYSR